MLFLVRMDVNIPRDLPVEDADFFLLQQVL